MTLIEAVPFCNYFFINSFEETMPYHLEIVSSTCLNVISS